MKKQTRTVTRDALMKQLKDYEWNKEKEVVTTYWDEIEVSLSKLNKATNMEWTHEETGGGCDCFWLQLSHGYYMLTRDASAPITDEDYDCLSLGWYKEDDCEGVMVESVTDFASLVEWAKNH